MFHAICGPLLCLGLTNMISSHDTCYNHLWQYHSPSEWYSSNQNRAKALAHLLWCTLSPPACVALKDTVERQDFGFSGHSHECILILSKVWKSGWMESDGLSYLQGHHIRTAGFGSCPFIPLALNNLFYKMKMICAPLFTQQSWGINEITCMFIFPANE